ncbi:DNA repair protein RadC [soil metagenome]
MSSASPNTRKAQTPRRRKLNLRDPSKEGAIDHELLASLLAYSQGRLSATLLLRRFNSLGHVLSAEPSQLTEFGALASDVTLLRLVRRIACRLLLGAVQSRPALGNWQAVLDYCQAAMAYDQVERFRILFLDRKNNLIVAELQQQGTVDHTPVYPREVVKRALLLNASALILVHNHPSGDPMPSRDDVEMTRKLREALDPLGIALHDHLVIGHGKHASFRALGLL